MLVQNPFLFIIFTNQINICMKFSGKEFSVLFLLLLIAGQSLSQSYWLRQPSPTTRNISKCTFIDSLNGWASGDSGLVIHTSTGGQNWLVQNTAKFNYINNQTGYGCGGARDIFGKVWKTTDAGISWKNFCASPEPLYDIKFVNNIIIASGGDFDYGAMTVRSVNSGGDWTFSYDSC